MSSACITSRQHSVIPSARRCKLPPPMAVATTSRPSHPPGLYVLFFTELWERYSFYSMMAILSLYMNEALHFSVAHVGQVYGLYNAGVYLMPVAGGLIADRWLGFSRAIIAGGV